MEDYVFSLKDKRLFKAKIIKLVFEGYNSCRIKTFDHSIRDGGK